MIILWQLLALLAVHWLADFVLQTHWQASNKSKNLEALLRHIGTYTLVLGFCVPAIFPIIGWSPAFFVIVNGVLHFATDYCTSKWTARLYAKQDWHNFFVVVGFDQLIHQAILALTMAWLLS